MRPKNIVLYMLSRRLLRIKVIKALFAHLKSGADNMMASEKTLMASVDLSLIHI